MKGIYKTKEGSKVEVIDFDEANKIAMVKVDELQNRWADESEYSTWEKEGEEIEDAGSEEIADAIEPNVEAPTLEVYEEPIEETIISEVNETPIEEEPKKVPKKKVTKQPVKKTTKKKTK